MHDDTKRARRRVAIVTAALGAGAAVAALAPGVAGAATAKIDGSGTLSFTGQAGETNRLTITASGGTLVLTDAGSHIRPGEGCTAGPPSHEITCGAVTSISVSLGDKDDLLDVGPGVAAVVARGGAGDDVLRGGDGDDVLIGDAGRDRLDGRAGADDLRGGADIDTADYSARTNPVTVSADDNRDDGEAGERDNVAVGVENILGGAGDDVLRGSKLANTLSGNGGHDRLQGFAGSDVLDGGPGADEVVYSEKNAPVTVTLDGVADDGTAGENDRIISVQDIVGGAKADTLKGNSAANVIRGGPGADTLEGGDGPDVLEGGNGADVMAGGRGADRVTYAASPAGVTVTLDDVADDGRPGEGDRVDVSVEEVEGSAFDDTLVGNDSANSFLGGDGDDTITGKARDDRIDGGAGDDTIAAHNGADVVAGGPGHDFVRLGNGDDSFVWRPGDASDTVAGDANDDTLRFIGDDEPDLFELSSSGAQLRVAHQSGGTVGAEGFETLHVEAQGGADRIVVDDLSAAGVTPFVSLGANPGGDDATDRVAFHGTDAADAVEVDAAGSAVTVSGVGRPLTITNVDPGRDGLTVGLGDGADSFATAGDVAALVTLLVNGGPGDDVLAGGNGPDILMGEGGDDTITGRQGDDTVRLGGGNDTAVWQPGDGSDEIEGQEGTDALDFTGSAAAERFDVHADGARVRLTRNVASIVMSTDEVETIRMRTLGGADTVEVSDLTGTAAANVQVALESAEAGGDGAADHVIATATDGPDVTGIHVNPGRTLRVTGLPVALDVSGGEGGVDAITARLGGGDDQFSVDGNLSALMKLTVEAGTGDDRVRGGNGNDVIVAGEGNDTVDGQPGNDTVLLGRGDDTFEWQPGDGSDTIEGQGDVDTLRVDGSSLGEAFNVSANGVRTRITRNIANVVMDAAGLEEVQLETVGGADDVTVDDMTGTGLWFVRVNLAGTIGGSAGDGQPDDVIVNGTPAADQITVSGEPLSGAAVSGLPTRVTIRGPEAANDRLTVNGLGGTDTLRNQLKPHTIGFTFNQ